GSRPMRFPGIAFDDPDIYDSDQIFTMRRLPGDIAIVGGGPVGVEFATIFTALGVLVTLVDSSDRLLPNMDGELTRTLAQHFAHTGIRRLLGTRLETVSRDDGRLRLTLSNGAIVGADAALFAAGRVANTDGLGLDAAGIGVDRRGRIVVDRYFQT